MGNYKSFGTTKRFVILIGVVVVLLLIAVVVWPILAYHVKLIRASGQATDGQYLSGSVTDENHAYENIKSIMVKTEGTETEDITSEDTIYGDVPISAYISFMDGSAGPDAEIEYGEDDSAVLFWSTYTEVDGSMVKEEKSISFSYINCYPNGFYIIANQDVYSYTETLDNRSGEYTFGEDDVNALEQKYSYVPVDEYYAENESSSGIQDTIAEIEEYIDTFADTDSYRSLDCMGDYNYQGYYYDGTT